MPTKILQDVIAYIYCCDSQHNAKAAIQQRLHANGGKIKTRLSSEVTHVVFERKRSHRPADKAAEAAEITELYRKVEQLEYPPLIISPLWVEQSISEGRRLIETRFTVARPKGNIILTTTAPGSTAGNNNKRKRGPVAAAAPRAVDDLELDPMDPFFSSSQQIRGDGTADGDTGNGEVSSPKPAKRNVRSRQRRRTQGPDTLLPALPTLPAAINAGGVGMETQAVADILAIDLPGDEDGIENAGSDDDLDTPLNVRFARKSFGTGGSIAAAAFLASNGSSAGAVGDGGRRKAVGSEAARSRLARGSGPDSNKAPQPQELGNDDNKGTTGEKNNSSKNSGASNRPGSSNQGVAQRFSVRVLQSQIEKPVLLNRGTPFAGAMPPITTVKKKSKSDIPIPGIQRIDSPWNIPPGGAAALGATPGSLSQPSQPMATPVDAADTMPTTGPAVIPTINNKPTGPLGGGGAAARGGSCPSPWSAIRPWDAKKHLTTQKGRGASRLRTGGPSPLGAHEEGEEMYGFEDNNDTNEDLPSSVSEDEEEMAGNELEDDTDDDDDGYDDENKGQQKQQPGDDDGNKRKTATRQTKKCTKASTVAAGKKEKATKKKKESATGKEIAYGPGPTHGCIAVTSVGSGVAALCKSATRRLRGLRLCADGREESVTHLVIGQERRTLKLMLAVANGAWLLSPEWITASIEAGRWLPECHFPADVRFVAAADKAREMLEVPDAALPLHDHQVYVHAAGNGKAYNSSSGSSDGPPVAALKRLVAALGGTVVPLQQCTVCVVAGSGDKVTAPSQRLPRGAVVVKEQWLLEGAERFEAPPLAEYVIA